jgi:hypothetical protein
MDEQTEDWYKGSTDRLMDLARDEFFGIRVRRFLEGAFDAEILDTMSDDEINGVITWLDHLAEVAPMIDPAA